MTQDFNKEYHNFLCEFLNNSEKCKKCVFNHEWLGGCFFASDCLPNNYKHLKKVKNNL